MFEIRSPYFAPITTNSAAVAVLLFACFDTASLTQRAVIERVCAEKVDGIEQ